MGSHESSNRRLPVSLLLQLLFIYTSDSCHTGNLYCCNCQVISLSFPNNRRTKLTQNSRKKAVCCEGDVNEKMS